MSKKIEKFLEWLLEPVVEGVFIPDDDNLPKYTNIYVSHNEKKQFRPSNFWEYIGQEKIKERLYHYINGTQKRGLVFPHTLICGNAGGGKTTLAHIIAKELKVNFVEVVASDLEEIDNILEKINETNGGVFFQDEIHSLPRELAEKMYSIMEDFKHNGNFIKPFTLIGATTELGEILQNRKPFVDRFKIILELENYTIKDLMKIAEQYKDRMFPKDVLDKNVYEVLAMNCRATPRALIRLLEASIYFNGNIKNVLNNFNIIKDGFTVKDLTILKYIALNEKGVGLQGIANFLGTSADNYVYHIEPFLLQNELIVRTNRGRKISQKGLEFIKEIGNNYEKRITK